MLYFIHLCFYLFISVLTVLTPAFANDLSLEYEWQKVSSSVMDSLLLLLLILIRVFHISVSWWSSTGDWVTASLLSIQADLNNAVVWMFSTRPPTSKSSRPFNNPLVTVSKAPITIGIIVTFMIHSFFFQFSSKIKVLISVFTFSPFYSVVSRDSKVINFVDFLSFFFVVDYFKVWSSGRDLVIRLYIKLP